MRLVDPDPERIARIMRWLHANDITEEAHEIGSDVHVDETGYIVYRTANGGPLATMCVRERVTFREANRA